MQGKLDYIGAGADQVGTPLGAVGMNVIDQAMQALPAPLFDVDPDQMGAAGDVTYSKGGLLPFAQTTYPSGLITRSNGLSGWNGRYALSCDGNGTGIELGPGWLHDGTITPEIEHESFTILFTARVGATTHGGSTSRWLFTSYDPVTGNNGPAIRWLANGTHGLRFDSQQTAGAGGINVTLGSGPAADTTFCCAFVHDADAATNVAYLNDTATVIGSTSSVTTPPKGPSRFLQMGWITGNSSAAWADHMGRAIVWNRAFTSTADKTGLNAVMAAMNSYYGI